ncbi:hypothetical protein A20C1_06431 [marine actinobacterium PHSC20C1]|nr:hypothetical protein A20C1_06431 [marine actinobacterium PHSC20C1]
MKRLFIGTLIAFGLGAVSLAAITAITSVARANGTVWGSADGLTPMWPMGVAFTAMWLMALSFALLIVLAIIGLIRDAVVKRRTRIEV